MKPEEKALVNIWLNDIIDDPLGYKSFYTDHEQRLLAQNALELTGDFNCVDYVIAHKQYPIQQDNLYRTLCVGNYFMFGCMSEHDGDSISEYNSRINECTGLYWIWKNTSSKYVGLSHYRRFFYRELYPDDMCRLDKKRIKEILIDDDYDIILSLKLNLNWPVYENMQKTVGVDFCDRGYKAFYNAIRSKQPDYLDAFEHVFKENRMYACNMFVTRREILNQYCEWLFSFLLEAADNIDISDAVFIQPRTAGYFAEIMWTVWLERQNLKIYELPIMQC